MLGIHALGAQALGGLDDRDGGAFTAALVEAADTVAAVATTLLLASAALTEAADTSSSATQVPLTAQVLLLEDADTLRATAVQTIHVVIRPQLLGLSVITSPPRVTQVTATKPTLAQVIA